jgi:hypothetical protein
MVMAPDVAANLVAAVIVSPAATPAAVVVAPSFMPAIIVAHLGVAVVPRRRRGEGRGADRSQGDRGG